MSDWFALGIIWGQSAMLVAAGFMLMNGNRLVRHGATIITEQQALLREEADIILFHNGVLAALQSGAITLHNIRPVDFRNLPVEMRLCILQALADVAITVDTPEGGPHGQVKEEVQA